MEEKSTWGGTRAGAGRKKGSVKGDNYASARIVLCCTPEEADKIKALAKENGKNVSRFIVETVLK